MLQVISAGTGNRYESTRKEKSGKLGRGVGCCVRWGEKSKGGVEVAARDSDLVRVVGAYGVFYANHGGSLAKEGDVGTGEPLGGTSELGGELVWRQPRV
jgi:hypothetical protein